MRRYEGTLYDRNRWDGFELRPGDILIASPPKCGTVAPAELVEESDG